MSAFRVSTLLRRLFRKPRPAPARRAPAPRLGVETLESREVPAYLSGGTLVIEGTAGDDVVTVTYSAGTYTTPRYTVVENGRVQNFSPFAVTAGQVTFRGRDGDDAFVNNSGLRAVADGGNGNDTLTGGWVNDYLVGGNGADTLRGRDGNDEIVGGNNTILYFNDDGGDTIYGGNGDDLLGGNEGDDQIHGEAGRDTLSGLEGNDRLDGGPGNDDLYGYWGDDLLSGGDGQDYVSGNEGNDRVFGGTGNDRAHGGPGNDVVSGEAGDDQVFGNDGDDQVIGGGGADELSGGNGDDALVAIDAVSADRLWADAGRDTLWVDEVPAGLGGPVWVTDTVYGVDATLDRVQRVRGFANGADRTLDGDMIADPDATVDPMGDPIPAYYQNFAGRPLFADAGPARADVRQQNRGDCWLMAAAAAVATDNPHAVRHTVADAGDGTYLVRLGDSFYRVDADLPTWSLSLDPRNAALGRQDSLWVAVVEKAYAHYLTGGADHSYRSLDGDSPSGAAAALGLTAVEQAMYGTIFDPSTSDTTLYGTPDGLGNELWTRWGAGQNVTLCTDAFVPDGSPLAANHCYAVTGVFVDNEGNPTSIRLYNPWGSELVVSIEDAYYAGVWVTWGTA